MAFEGLRDRWEHMAPRERNLLMLLGATAVICLFALVANSITSGLDRIETGNEEKREALKNLVVLKQQKSRQSSGPTVKIGTEAPSLSTYLEEISKEVGVQIPNYQPQPPIDNGGFEEISGRIELREVTVYQLAEFLEKVETKNRTVVVTSLTIEKSRRDQDKLRKAAMVVSTYRQKKAPAPAEGEETDG